MERPDPQGEVGAVLEGQFNLVQYLSHHPHLLLIILLDRVEQVEQQVLEVTVVMEIPADLLH
jgi:hypothetical protein